MLTAVRFAILILLLGGVLYPLAMTGLGQIFFSSQANGSFIKLSTGKIVASRLIGQVFTRPEYFHSRPSANAYDAANSGGSNLAPTSRKLIERMKRDAVLYRKENPQQTALPIDALTASASGLDPHISLANALVQVPRVAPPVNFRQALLRAWWDS